MNNLWILRPKFDADEDLWEPWYDKSFGFVVLAGTEFEARKLAASKHGDEGAKAWLDDRFSSCDILKPEGEKGIIIQDFHSA